VAVVTRGHYLPGYDRATREARPPHREGCKQQGRTVKADGNVPLHPPFVQRKGQRGERGRETGIRYDSRAAMAAHLERAAEARRLEVGIGLLSTNGSSSR
jgi:hypothetical protein